MSADDFLERHSRYSSRAAIAKLSALLRLPNDPGMQDWEIQVADHARLDEFLVAYGLPELDEDDRFTLMQLIVASLDDAVSAEPLFEPLWRRAAGLIRRDAHIHATTLAYWARGNDRDPDHQFRITPRVRALWHEVRPAVRKRYRLHMRRMSGSS